MVPSRLWMITNKKATIGSAPLTLPVDPIAGLWLSQTHPMWCLFGAVPNNEVAVWSPYQHCSHTFHQSCILVGLLDSPECPLCKNAFIIRKHSEPKQDETPSENTIGQMTSRWAHMEVWDTEVLDIPERRLVVRLECTT